MTQSLAVKEAKRFSIQCLIFYVFYFIIHLREMFKISKRSGIFINYKIDLKDENIVLHSDFKNLIILFTKLLQFIKKVMR